MLNVLTTVELSKQPQVFAPLECSQSNHWERDKLMRIGWEFQFSRASQLSTKKNGYKVGFVSESIIVKPTNLCWLPCYVLVTIQSHWYILGSENRKSSFGT